MTPTTYFILALINFSLAKDCVLDYRTRAVLWERQLKKDLTCDTSIFYPPKPTNQTIPIKIKFKLRYFTFSSNEEILSMQQWMFVSWKDERLKWDPDKYGGITETDISSASIWAPGFLIYNSADSEDFDRILYYRCKLNNTGLLECIHQVYLNARCSVNLTDFPYDSQECSVQYGLWPKVPGYNLTTSERAVSMWGADYGSQWFISDYRQQSPNEVDQRLNVTFVFEREAQSLASVIIYPSLIISGLSIACLYLDVRSNVRLSLLCFSLFCHYFWLVELSYNLPKENVNPPRLLLYYRGTTILTTLMIFITFVLTAVTKKVSAPHNIIITVNNFVFESYAKFLVYPRWDVENKVSDIDKFSEDWVKFANCVNSVCAFIIKITYVSLYIAFIPQPIPITY